MEKESKKQLRVAWLYENLLWWNGGIRYLLEVSQRLAQRCDIKIYTTRACAENKSKFFNAGVPIVEFSCTSVDNKRYWIFFPFYIISNTVRLRRLLKDYDIVISTSPTTCLIAAMLNNRKIFVMYDVNFWLYSEEFLNSIHPVLRYTVQIIKPVARVIDRWAVRKADAIVTICNYTARLMDKVYTRKPLIMHEGVNSFFFVNSHKSEFEERYSGRAVLIHLASYISPTRGTRYIIEALPIIRNSIPNILLLILNPSNETVARNKLKQLAQDLGVSDHLQFAPPVGDNELPYYYSLAKIVVQPSLDENTHLPVEEGSACEVPVITFKGTLAAEDMIDGITGIEVPKGDVNALADAVVRLVQDNEFNRQAGKNAREHIINNFSWDKNAEEMWGLICRITTEENVR